MKVFLKLLPLFILVISCTESEKNIQQYSIETLMSNNRSSGGSFSKDASKLVYSSDKSGIFNIYEVNLENNIETQITDSKEESFFVRGYSPTTGEVIYAFLVPYYVNMRVFISTFISRIYYFTCGWRITSNKK